MPAVCVSHGFRKNFTTQLVSHQVPTHEIQQLVGHTADELVHNVYSGGVTLDRLAEGVALVDYGGVVMGAAKRARQEELPRMRRRGRPRQ